MSRRRPVKPPLTKQQKRERHLAAPQPADNPYGQQIQGNDTRALADTELHRRIGPATPTRNEDDDRYN